MRSPNSDSYEPESAPSGIQLGDVYYALFRHKWKIVFCALAGVLAAAYLFKTRTPLFSSQAKLLVRYVVESKSFASGGGDLKTPDAMGTGIINAEVEILNSFDVARDVATAVGPARILGITNDVGSVDMAAGLIQAGLKVSNPGRGNVILVEFQHRDAAITQVVLRQLIDSYFRKHIEIHRAAGIMDEVLTKRSDELRLKLADTEEKLRQLKTNANIVSVEDTKKAHLDMLSRIRSDLFAAKAELAERLASVMRMTNVVAAVSTNALSGTNAVETTNQSAVASTASRADEYRRVVGQLEFFLRRQQELATQFTESNALVREYRLKVEENQREKLRLEQEDPSLLRGTVLASSGGDPNAVAAVQESFRVVALTARIGELTNQLSIVQREASRVEEVENKVHELERQRAVEENQFKAIAQGLEQSRLDESIGPGKLPNINEIQQPTPPGKDFSKLYKKVGMVAMGGFGAGIALALLIELFLDQSVRRSSDVQRKLRLPVFINIPRLRGLRRAVAGGHNGQHKALPAPEANGGGSLLPALRSISSANSAVQPYADALRDRLIHYFQKNNMTHKPKLVALTGCGDGVGVSTLAAGLAASLSETGDGNVLLVDTNVTEGAALPFYRGKLACGLHDVLKEDMRGGAQVQDNLYVASASDSDGALIKALPKRFSQLVPKLKASDYDYIIFDMPPVSQTSITSKLAGYMDMVLLVVESEKTGRSIVSEASDLLHDSRANVATVINKSRRYVPRWVHREFE